MRSSPCTRPGAQPPHGPGDTGDPAVCLAGELCPRLWDEDLVGDKYENVTGKETAPDCGMGSAPCPGRVSLGTRTLTTSHRLLPGSLPAGFNLIKRFDLLKISSIKKVRGLRGPAVLRLGAVPLVQPTR